MLLSRDALTYLSGVQQLHINIWYLALIFSKTLFLTNSIQRSISPSLCVVMTSPHQHQQTQFWRLNRFSMKLLILHSLKSFSCFREKFVVMNELIYLKTKIYFFDPLTDRIYPSCPDNNKNMQEIFCQYLPSPPTKIPSSSVECTDLIIAEKDVHMIISFQS